MTVEMDDLDWGSQQELTAVPVCRLSELMVERGVAALVRGRQIALFRLVGDEVVAVQQADPYSGAQVLSRGIVGSQGARATLASPMYKQVFDLHTGECLDPVGQEPRALRTYGVQVVDGLVCVDLPVCDPGP